MSEAEQLAALARVHELLVRQGIEHWLFGGWAVDFHAGAVTRPHDDLDIAVWLKDHNRIAALLAADGWKHAPEEDEDGYTGYERRTVRLELAFLACRKTGRCTPLREGRAAWPDEAFDNDVAELLGLRAKVITLRALKADKSELATTHSWPRRTAPTWRFSPAPAKRRPSTEDPYLRRRGRTRFPGLSPASKCAFSAD